MTLAFSPDPPASRCSCRLRAAIGPHVAALARAGFSVALDFPANTRRSRQWLLRLAQAAGCGHRLHYYLDVPAAECKARLHRRNAEGGIRSAPTKRRSTPSTPFSSSRTGRKGWSSSATARNTARLL
ncbi:AAA family ATPase [Achromobacter sp. DMS1]|uniref:AAA family ATPase n=1 Tax=Achromobacter sp. DMS1 TaxID=1688405 RepID=UPI00069F1458|nr:AAA family ATPase [Achromobacter sp. DMS1]